MNPQLDANLRTVVEDMTRQNAALDLGCETSKDSVTTNPNRSAERAGSEDVVPRGPEADEELRKMVLAKAESIYGSPLPEIVRTRVDKELGAIVGHGFSTLYLIAAKLVSKLQADGHVAGYRTLAGSSLAAYLSGIRHILQRQQQEAVEFFILDAVILDSQARGAFEGNAIRRVSHDEVGALTAHEALHVFRLGGITAEQPVPADRPEIARLHKGGFFQRGGQVKVIILCFLLIIAHIRS